MTRVKFFLIELDLILGSLVFRVQSPFSRCLQDVIRARLWRLDTNPPLLEGSYTGSLETLLPKDHRIDKRKLIYASEFKKVYQLGPTMGTQTILSQNYNAITRYLGRNFLVEGPYFYEIVAMPKELRNHEVYGNLWHQDSHDGNRLLKIFVLVEDVDTNKGPLVYLDLQESKAAWAQLRKRWSFDVFANGPRTFGVERLFTGLAGDYLMLDTSRIFHRAGNPENSRGILEITLYPSWRKAAGREPWSGLGVESNHF